MSVVPVCLRMCGSCVSVYLWFLCVCGSCVSVCLWFLCVCAPCRVPRDGHYQDIWLHISTLPDRIYRFMALYILNQLLLSIVLRYRGDLLSWWAILCCLRLLPDFSLTRIIAQKTSFSSQACNKTLVL